MDIGHGSSMMKPQSTAQSPSSREIFHFLTRLHHGILRFPKLATVDDDSSTKTDRRFVFVPTGYTSRDEQGLWRILNEVGLKKLPHLIMTVASASPRKNEKAESPKDVDTQREALLATAVDMCSSVGAWIIPERPWSFDGAAPDIVRAMARVQAKQESASVENSEVGTKSIISLGLLALNETSSDQSSTMDDASEFLKKAVMGKMVPVGSSQGKKLPVTILEGGKSLPCQDLSHYIIFQNHREKCLFQEKLIQLVPDLLLLSGELTLSAKRQMTLSVFQGSPLSLICSSSGATTAVDKFAKMFRHVDSELATVKQLAPDSFQYYGDNSAIGTADSSETTICLSPLKGSTENKDENDEIVEKFLRNWPLSYKKEKVVIADPRDIDESSGSLDELCRFYKQLLVIAVTSAFSRSPIVKVPMPIENNITPVVAAAEQSYAQACLKVLKQSISRQKFHTGRIHALLVTTTFLAMVATVAYAKLYGAKANIGDDLIEGTDVIDIDEAKSAKGFAGLKDSLLDVTKSLLDKLRSLDTLQLIIYFATILLPLYITRLQSASDFTKDKNTLRSWSALEAAAAKMESEIIKFRAQVGPYALYTRRVKHVDETTGESFGALVLRCRQIFNQVHMQVSDKEKRELMTQLSNCNKTRRIDESSLKSGDNEPSKQREIKLGNDAQISDRDIEEALETPTETTQLLPALSVSVDEEEQLEKASIVPNPNEWVKYSGTNIDYPKYKAFEDEVTEYYDDDPPSDEYEVVTNTDYAPGLAQTGPRFVPMTVDEYLETRLEKQIKWKSDEIQSISRRSNSLKKSINYLTMSTCVLAALSYQWFIPIVLGLIAALVMEQEFRKYDQRYNLGKTMVDKLSELKVWWASLSDDEILLEENKERLILESEDVIVSELCSTFGPVKSNSE